ncbi:MAG TPA: DUF58 domain-containing protein, partial [Candidatus Dormibacteraeota bacterium]|nr:DUF58 domain-containing protein [Candidatus Dormibacteraeota bacterium]
MTAWTTTASGRLPAYLALGGAGLLAGLLLGRPEPVVLAGPLLLAAAAGLALARPPDIDVSVRLDRERALEGEEVELEVTVHARRAVAWLDVEVRLPAGLAERRRAGVDGPGALAAGATRTYRRRVACRRWGGRLVGHVTMRARDPLGFFTYRDETRRLLPLRVYPRPEALRRLLRPAETQAFAGNEVSRLKGDGIEFADIRPFEPGDRVRRINWRASARRGQLHVNEMRPERNADVVVFLDTFTDLPDPDGTSLEMTVRAAAALVDGYLRRRDRVGLVGFGGTLRWLRPAMGERQLYRLVDALIDTQVVVSYAWKGLEVIPRRTLPPKSLVVAFTPLLDERTLGALFDLRGRGYDLSVVELSPLAFVRAGRRETERLAYRLWAMEREALRGRFLA